MILKEVQSYKNYCRKGDESSFFHYLCAMKKFFALFFVSLFLFSCGLSADEQAAHTMRQIDSLYRRGEYDKTLKAIEDLRTHHPRAIASRRHALRIWQAASLRLTQEDIGRTDSALQVVAAAYGSAADVGRRNRLRGKRDSLQARYDALCATVRVIRRRQQEQ